MRPTQEAVTARIREDEVLRLILEGTAAETGVPFFRALVRNLCEALHTRGAWVTEILPGGRRLRSLAFWMGESYVESYEYDVTGTPCEPVVAKRCLAHFPDRVFELFPVDSDLARFGALSYIGVPLFDVDGGLLGHLAAIDTKPMPLEPQLTTVFEIFAARAAAEYRRLKTEDLVLAREEQLRRLLDTAMDAILVFDASFAITRVNPAGERVFGRPATDLLSSDVRRLLDPDGARDLEARVRRLRGLPDGERSCWFPRDLKALRPGGTEFPAEATLSCFESGDEILNTLILRNIDEKVAAESRIRLLTEETEFLKESLHEAPGTEEILGKSPPMKELLGSVHRVAATDTTVLILGETGTGKELVARSIHAASRRRDNPLVRVNCAAIPTSLMESEFFGHEKGAFTGATMRREGRFALADGGTIFLDEVGELSLELQAKLLRVLQEGEFEALGSTKTRRVDVRVIAATNRDLDEMVRAGKFREDLYYRLAVFPLQVPPLRERGVDIGELAQFFAQQFARRMGRRVQPLRPADVERLALYSWPGNVRELQNVIERAIIHSAGSMLDLARALPETVRKAEPRVPPGASPHRGGNGTSHVRSAAEMQELERANILGALETAGWRVSGDSGAARILGIPPSTLTSRMRSLGIQRPARR